MQLPGFGSHAFNRRDTLSANFVREQRACADGQTIDQNRATAANLRFAGNFHSRQAAAPSQNFGERFALLDFERGRLSI
jgi:hypothetical protein